MVSRALTRAVINLLGRKSRERRRQDLYEDLKRHDVSESELAELGPYVAVAVDWAGPGLLIAAAFVVFIGVPMFAIMALLGIGYGLDSGSMVILLGGLVVALMIPYSLWNSYKKYRQRKQLGQLLDDLKSDPMSVIGTPTYVQLVENLDFKSGQAYPDVAPVNAEDALGQFEANPEEEPATTADTEAAKSSTTREPSSSAEGKASTEPTEEDTMDCPDCGTTVDLSASFCPDCGNELGAG